jgi:uncharacterized protein (DUF1800 family)
MTWFEDVDPKWAWSDSDLRDQPLGPSRASHLLRRAGFGVPVARRQELAELTAAEAAQRLLPEGEMEAGFRQASDSLRTLVLGTRDTKQAAAWWLYRMRNSPDPLREKMTLFWHGHFAASVDKVQETLLMVEQNDLLYANAVGDFRAMARGISRDPAMLIYLDSVTNRKRHPNENFARELMELFCLGEGNYTEKDVQELARCFTGWDIKGDRFRFNKYQHDNEPKSLFGKTNDFPDYSAVDWIVDHRACPKFLVRKLVAFFVADEPQPPAEFLAPLVEQMRADGMSVRGTLQRLFSANIFYSDQVVGRKIRSPVDFAVGILNTLDMNVDLVDLGERLVDLGQGLFRPPNVKGWPGGRAWINSSTLLDRANLVERLLRGEKTSFPAGGLQESLKKQGAQSTDEQVAWLLGNLLAVPVPADVQAQLLDVASNGKGNSETRLRTTLGAIATLPEFQLN